MTFLFYFKVLNLFLALLLNSFASDSIKRNKETKEDSKMKQGWKRLKGLFKPKSSSVEPAIEKKPSIANILLELKRQRDLRERQMKDLEKGVISPEEKALGVKTEIEDVSEVKKGQLLLIAAVGVDAIDGQKSGHKNVPD